jgi:hypothetical protein
MAKQGQRRTLSETKRLTGEMRRDARLIAEEERDIAARRLPFAFDNLEDQTAHALNILRILELTLMEGNNTLAFTDEDVDAMAGLLASANTLLEPLDIQGVAGALQLGDFAIVADGDKRRPTIACAKCSQEKGQSRGSKEASA